MSFGARCIPKKTSRRTCKPGSVERGHLSTLTVTGKLKRYLRLYSGGQPIRIQPNLASDGVYMARGVTVPSVSSCLAFPPLPLKAAVYFCCTFLEVAFT